MENNIVDISSIKDSASVSGRMVVKIKKKPKEYARGFYFELILSDSSGKSIAYKFWGDNNLAKINEFLSRVSEGDVVSIKGKVTEYRGKLEISSDELPEIVPEGEYDPQEFVRKPKNDTTRTFSEIMNYANQISNPELRKMIVDILESRKQELMSHPAAIEIHHNWIGGLMDHILDILKICEVMWNRYSLDSDLLIAGAILHDIGKLEEIKVSTRISGTRVGQLVGHIVLGSIYADRKMEEHGISGLLREKVLHMIVSHHGKFEYGSPKVPMIPEAIVLHYADELSSKTAEAVDFVESARQDTENEFMYSKRNERNFLLK